MVRILLTAAMVAAVLVLTPPAMAQTEPADGMIKSAFYDLERYGKQAEGLTPRRAANAKRILRMLSLVEGRLQSSPNKDHPSWKEADSRLVELKTRLEALAAGRDPDAASATTSAPPAAPTRLSYDDQRALRTLNRNLNNNERSLGYESIGSFQQDRTIQKWRQKADKLRREFAGVQAKTHPDAVAVQKRIAAITARIDQKIAAAATAKTAAAAPSTAPARLSYDDQRALRTLNRNLNNNERSLGYESIGSFQQDRTIQKWRQKADKLRREFAGVQAKTHPDAVAAQQRIAAITAQIDQKIAAAATAKTAAAAPSAAPARLSYDDQRALRTLNRNLNNAMRALTSDNAGDLTDPGLVHQWRQKAGGFQQDFARVQAKSHPDAVKVQQQIAALSAELEKQIAAATAAKATTATAAAASTPQAQPAQHTEASTRTAASPAQPAQPAKLDYYDRRAIQNTGRKINNWQRALNAVPSGDFTNEGTIGYWSQRSDRLNQEFAAIKAKDHPDARKLKQQIAAYDSLLAEKIKEGGGLISEKDMSTLHRLDMALNKLERKLDKIPAARLTLPPIRQAWETEKQTLANHRRLFETPDHPKVAKRSVRVAAFLEDLDTKLAEGDRRMAGLGDVPARMDTLRKKYFDLPPELRAPFEKEKVLAWAEQVKAMVDDQPADLAWLAKAEQNAIGIINTDRVNSLRHQIHHSLPRDLKLRVDASFREIDRRVDRGVQDAQWILDADPVEKPGTFLHEDKYKERFARMKEAEAFIVTIALPLDKAMSREDAPDRQAQTAAIAQAIAEFPSKQKTALDSQRMPKAINDSRLLGIAETVIAERPKAFTNPILRVIIAREPRRHAELVTHIEGKKLVTYKLDHEEMIVFTAERHDDGTTWKYRNAMRYNHSGYSTTPLGRWLLYQRYETFPIREDRIND